MCREIRNAAKCTITSVSTFVYILLISNTKHNNMICFTFCISLHFKNCYWCSPSNVNLLKAEQIEFICSLDTGFKNEKE